MTNIHHIKHYAPKGMNIAKINNKMIKNIENYINEHPRDIFNGKTSNKIYTNKLLKIGKL